MLTGLDCTTGPVTVTLVGGNASTASATPGTCSAKSFGDAPNVATGAAYPTTVSLTPATAVTNVAVLNATDSANNAGKLTVTAGHFILQGSKYSIVASQSSVILGVQGGGYPGACSFNAQMDPNGGSFGVSKDGDIAVAAPYGNVLNIYNAATGTVEVFPLSNVSGGTFDNQKNLFVGPFYKRNLYKLPYVSGDWVSGDLDAAPNCNATGIDTVMCKMPNVAGGDYNNNLDWKNAAFDSAGNLFMVTPTAGSGTAGGNKIYELTAANLYIGPPTLVYADDSTKNILSIAVDPWGNLFFVDGVYGELNGGNQNSASLNMLPRSSTSPTGFDAKAVVMTWTNPAPAAYGNTMSGVAVDENGTIYYSDGNGTYAVPNNLLTGPIGAKAYVVSSQGGKQLMPDGRGNLYAVADDWGGTTSHIGVYHILLNNVMVPDSTVGVASETTNVVTALGVDCSGSVTFAPAVGSA